MTFAQARNAIVSGLEAHIGCPVNLSEQIADMPEYPILLLQRSRSENTGVFVRLAGDC